MNTLQAGFSRVDVTPMLGIGIAGYYVPVLPMACWILCRSMRWR